MPDSDACWLLVLGSNTAGDERLRAAVDLLESLGEAEILGAPLLTQAEPPIGPPYTNALVLLRSGTGDLSVLKNTLVRIEAAFGRDRGRPDRVELDIDVLGLAGLAGWCPTVDAVRKNELSKGYVRSLLRNADINFPDGAELSNISSPPS